MTADLMFVLAQALREDMGIVQTGETWPHHPNLQAAVEAAQHSDLMVALTFGTPPAPYLWQLTDAGRAELDRLWKVSGRRGFDAPDFFDCPRCGRLWTFPGDAVACRECEGVTV